MLSHSVPTAPISCAEGLAELLDLRFSCDDLSGHHTRNSAGNGNARSLRTLWDGACENCSQRSRSTGPVARLASGTGNPRRLPKPAGVLSGTFVSPSTGPTGSRTMRKAMTRNPLDISPGPTVHLVQLFSKPDKGKALVGGFQHQYGISPGARDRARLRQCHDYGRMTSSPWQAAAAVSVLCRPSAGRRHDPDARTQI
jgi:hypothetical protein